MTKLEALAKDCIENHTHRLVDRPTEQDIYLREESIFIQGYRQSEKRITELEVKIKHLTKHLEPQTMSALFEQVEEEFKQEQRIKELETQIEKMKSQYDYAFNQLCKSREILCSMLSQYGDRKEIDYSTRECGEKLLKEGVCKND